jgi:hypothetical protein
MRPLVVVFVAAVLFALSLPIQGADITVINSPDTDCSVDFICDFQTALDFADTIPAQSDTLFLEPGMYNVPVDQATVTNVPFSFESSTDRVGALTIIGSGTDKTILNGVGASKALLINTVPGSGSVDFTIHDLSIVNGNSADTAGGGLDVRASVGDITIVNCVFSNSISGFEGGGLHAETASGGITVVESIFNGNSSGVAGGGAFVNSTGASAQAVTIGDTVFEDNDVVGAGSGGGVFAATAAARLGIVNGVFLGNDALDGGGASVTSSTGTISMVNNIADENGAANRGGASFVEVNNGRANLTNNTFVNSTAGDAGGGVFIEINGLNQSGPAVSSLDVFNNILWINNSVNPGKDIALDLKVGAIARLDSNTYQDFAASGQTGTNLSVTNTRNADPLLDAAYRLTAGSPAIDAGNNLATDLPDTDFEGDPRRQDGDRNRSTDVDIGADEFFAGAGDSDGTGECFIATAAYGSPLAHEVEVLRRFRDRRLVTNAPGRAFVKAYYRYSPPVASFIAGHESLRGATRMALTPVVFMIKHPVPGFFLSGLVIAAVVFRRRRR